jgi:hypothetical protein
VVACDRREDLVVQGGPYGIHPSSEDLSGTGIRPAHHKLLHPLPGRWVLKPLCRRHPWALHHFHQTQQDPWVVPVADEIEGQLHPAYGPMRIALE